MLLPSAVHSHPSSDGGGRQGCMLEASSWPRCPDLHGPHAMPAGAGHSCWQGGCLHHLVGASHGPGGGHQDWYCPRLGSCHTWQQEDGSDAPSLARPLEAVLGTCPSPGCGGLWPQSAGRICFRLLQAHKPCGIGPGNSHKADLRHAPLEILPCDGAKSALLQLRPLST